MKRNLKYIIPIGIVLLFIITNPSITAFKSYRGHEGYDGLKRPLNFFVCSVYRDRGSEFIGVFGNFIKVEKPMVALSTRQIDSAIMDSAKMDSSFHILTSVGIKNMPYKDRVYLALRENLTDFSESKEGFYQKIKDKNYDLKVYSALKDNLKDFNKSPDEFIKLVNE